jgi:hypothetical protein
MACRRLALSTLLVTAFLLASGCDALFHQDSLLSARLVGGPSGSESTSSLTQALDGDEVFQGIYFGEIEIVAYDYRPDEEINTTSGFGNGENWSYWVALQNGHDDGRDNVLAPGEQLDFDAFNGDFGRSLDAEFVREVGRFEVDFFEVNVYRTGIVLGERYLGMNAELNGLDRHPLHKYPEWAEYADTFTMPHFPGETFEQASQSLSILFARSDWFETPVLIDMDDQAAEVVASSRPLTELEQERIESLVGEGTMRRFYDRLVVVPFEGPHVFELDGETHPTVSVYLDLENAVDVEASILDPEAEGFPRVVYQGDENDVPFGLEISFE